MKTITLDNNTLKSVVATANLFTSKDGEFAGQITISGEDSKLEVKASDGVQKVIYKNIPFVSSDLTDTDFLPFSIDGKKLTTALKAAKKDDTHIEIHSEKIVVKSGRSKIIIDVFANTQEVSISRGNKKLDFLSLINGLEQVLHSVDVNNPRPELTGISLDFKDGACSIAGTDTKRLAVVQTTTTVEDCSYIVPRKAIETISKLFKGYKLEAEIVEDVAMTFHSEHLSYSTQLINSKFIEWKRIVPKSFTQTVTLQKSLLLELVKEASIFNQEVIINFNSNNITVCDFDNSTEIVEEFETNADFKFAVQSKMITDFLSSYSEENVDICFNEDNLPILLKANNEYFEIVMPIVLPTIADNNEEVQNVA